MKMAKKPPTTLVSFKLDNETYKKLLEFYDEWKEELPTVNETGLRVEHSPAIAARKLMLESLDRWKKKRG